MESILSPVSVKKDSLVNNVKLVLMTARMELIVIPAFEGFQCECTISF